MNSENVDTPAQQCTSHHNDSGNYNTTENVTATSVYPESLPLPATSVNINASPNNIPHDGKHYPSHHDNSGFYYTTQNGTATMVYPQSLSIPIAPMNIHVYPNGIPYDDQNVYYYYNPPHHNPRRIKQGHLCCGGCCDVRRAVIIVNSIILFIIGFNLLFMGMFLQFNQTMLSETKYYYEEYYDDDYTMSQLDQSIPMANVPIEVFLFIVLIRLIFTLMGIIGAFQYNVCLIVTATILYCCDFIVFGVLMMNPVGIILFGLIVYPHVVLISEINRRIMTKENYHNEEFCCCCV